jgi:hypothetical protein
MKLGQDADARARMRLLRMWLSPEQYREICAGLQQVEVPARKALRHRIALALGEARNAAAACLRNLADLIGGAQVVGDSRHLNR